MYRRQGPALAPSAGPSASLSPGCGGADGRSAHCPGGSCRSTVPSRSRGSSPTSARNSAARPPRRVPATRPWWVIATVPSGRSTYAKPSAVPMGAEGARRGGRTRPGFPADSPGPGLLTPVVPAVGWPAPPGARPDGSTGLTSPVRVALMGRLSSSTGNGHHGTSYPRRRARGAHHRTARRVRRGHRRRPGDRQAGTGGHGRALVRRGGRRGAGQRHGGRCGYAVPAAGLVPPGQGLEGEGRRGPRR